MSSLSAAKQIVWPLPSTELLRQQPACEALNRTMLNLVNARPCVPKENILLIEAIHDLFVDRKSMEALGMRGGVLTSGGCRMVTPAKSCHQA